MEFNATRSNNIEKLAEALAAAQKEISNPKKEAKNPFYKSTYSDLPSVLGVIREVLPNHGLAFSQPLEMIGENLFLTTLLMHTSGQWIKSYMPVVAKDMKDPQKLGSGISYARRYSLQAIVGIVGDDDDDGNKAAGKEQNGNGDDDVVREFLGKWDAEYGQENLVAFIKAKAQKLGIKERACIKIYAKNDDGFEKEIDEWKKGFSEKKEM